MGLAGFDTRELAAYTQSLTRMANELPKKQKKFLSQEGTKLLRKTRSEARRVKDKTGNYRKKIKKGKVYSYHSSQAVRVYTTAAHAHLIEDGHRQVTHDGREVGFVPGMHIFEVSGKEFEATFEADADDFLTGL